MFGLAKEQEKVFETFIKNQTFDVKDNITKFSLFSKRNKSLEVMQLNKKKKFHISLTYQSSIPRLAQQESDFYQKKRKCFQA